MTDIQPPSGPGWARLIAAPAEVVRQLKGQYLLLVAMGSAVLLVLIGFVIPSAGQFYAWLLAGLVFALSLLWALTLRRREPTTTQKTASGNFIETRRLRARNVKMTASNTNSIKSRGGAVIEGLTMSSGSQVPTEPTTLPAPSETDAGER
ncbi:hypothetical protein ACI2K4_13740 [Micromonospora sp. NPDC050397]|uniref:hypothetical protein n=1 Tax=Micromonospora sp. NPDC050397 TaxID=3364279 RepID=UPI00384E0780